MTTVRPKKFLCPFDLSGITELDYKDVALLSRYITYHRSIQSRHYTGVSPKMQKKLSLAIKRARFMGLLPYVRYAKKEFQA